MKNHVSSPETNRTVFFALKQTDQKSFFSHKQKFISVVISTILAVSSMGVALTPFMAKAEVAQSDLSPISVSVLSNIDAGLTPKLAGIEKRVTEIKNYLLTKYDGKESRLDFTARLINAIRSVNELSFTELGVFIHPEGKILGNFITENDATKYYETGETGENWDIISYFKDDNGKKTDIPEIAYIAEKKYKNNIKGIQKAIDMWTKIVPDFLEVAVKNDVRFLFQAVSSSTKDGSGLFKYDPDIIYWDEGNINDVIVSMAGWRRALGVEPFGARLESLGIYNGMEIGVLKQALATACCDNLAVKTKDDLPSNFAESYRSDLEDYMEKYNISQDHVNEMVYNIITHPGYVTPYSADNWTELKSDVITKAIEWAGTKNED
jgi:hypothetical protein